jgi:hypothetical protein
LEILPDIPTVGEFVPGFEASFWVGLGAPRNTSVEVVGNLNKQINAALVDPKMRARFADAGGTVLPGSPADFGRLIAEETSGPRWSNSPAPSRIEPRREVPVKGRRARAPRHGQVFPKNPPAQQAGVAPALGQNRPPALQNKWNAPLRRRQSL